MLTAFEATYGESPGTPYWAYAYDATTLLLSAIDSVAVEAGGKLYIDRAALRKETPGQRPAFRASSAYSHATISATAAPGASTSTTTRTPSITGYRRSCRWSIGSRREALINGKGPRGEQEKGQEQKNGMKGRGGDHSTSPQIPLLPLHKLTVCATACRMKAEGSRAGPFLFFKQQLLRHAGVSSA